MRFLTDLVGDVLYWWREQGHPESVAFDETYGTETVRFSWLHAYEPTRPAVLEEILDALHLDWSRYTFVDLGSGRGRVVLLAGRRPFLRVVGVEISQALHRASEENLRSFQERARLVSPVHLLHGDAGVLPLPEGPLLLFLFNPFDARVLRRILARLEGRELVLAYVNPVEASVVEDAGLTELCRGREGQVQSWKVFSSEGSTST